MICVFDTFLGYDVQRQIKIAVRLTQRSIAKWFTKSRTNDFNDLSLPYTYGIVIPFLTKK